MMKENELAKFKVENGNITVIVYKDEDGNKNSAAYVNVTKTNLFDIYREMNLVPICSFEYNDFIKYINGNDTRTDAKKITMEEVLSLVAKHFFL